MRVLGVSVFVALLLAAHSAGAQLSEGSKAMLAAMINVSGQLCARVTAVEQVRRDVYAVSCVRYRDGTGRATYEVNALTGAVK